MKRVLAALALAAPWLPCRADDRPSGADALQKAQAALQAGGLDVNKHLKVNDDGSVNVSGSDAHAALRKAGIDIDRVNVRDALPAFTRAEVGSKAREVLKAQGMDPDKYIGADGVPTKKSGYAQDALKAAETALRLDHFGPVRVDPAPPAGSGPGGGAGTAGAAAPDPAAGSAAGQMSRVRQILLSKGFDPRESVQIRPDGDVEASTRYARHALEEAGIDVTKIHLPGAASFSWDPPAPLAPKPAFVAPPADPALPPAEPGLLAAPHGLKLDVVDKAARELVEKASAFSRGDKYSSAAPVYQEAFEQAKKSGDLQAAASAMVGLGSAQRQLKDRDAAEKTYGEANTLLQFLRGSGDDQKKKDADRLLAVSEHGLGAIDLVRGDLGSALGHYRRSADYYREGGFNALVTLSGDAIRIQEMTNKLKASGKSIPAYPGLPDPKDEIAAGLGRSPAPPPGPSGTPPAAPPGPGPGPGTAPPVVPAADFGFGLTRGGEGGKAFLVTSLADSGAGTLREALARADAVGGGAIIQFGVEGAIRLRSTLQMNSPNVTIDGFSAPGKGITLFGDQAGQAVVHVKTHDVILRNLAVRNGYDQIRVQGDSPAVHHVLLDHLSLTDAGDGAVDITKGAHDVTVQWSYIAGAGSASGGGGSLVKYGATNVTYHHNFFDKNLRRSVLADHAFVDFRNNVVRDWRQYGTHFTSGSSGNAVENVYSSKPGTGEGGAAHSLVAWHGAGPVYFDGNLFKGQASASPGTASSELDAPGVPTESAAAAERAVLDIAGKGRGDRDAVDLKYMSLPDYGAVRNYRGD